MPKGGSKKGAPQSKNLVPLTQRPPEEAKRLRSEGGKAHARKMAERKTRDEMFRQILSMGIQSGRVVDPAELENLSEADEANIPIYARIILQEVQKYFLTGDTEARNFLLNNAFPEKGITTFDGNGNSAPGPSQPDEIKVDADSDGGVKIVLVRGQKVDADSKSEEEEEKGGKATRGEGVAQTDEQDLH